MVRSNDSSTGPPPAPGLDVLALGKGIQVAEKSELKLTSNRARRFVGDLAEFEGERNAGEAWIDTLAREMARRTFRWEHVILATAVLDEDGKEYRVNGQHTCWARLRFDGDGNFDGVVTQIKYRVKTTEDLRQLYSAFDQHKKRSKSQIVLAQLVGFQAWKDVGHLALKLVAQGFPLYHYSSLTDRKASDTLQHAYLLKTDYMDLGVRVGMFLSDPSGAAGKTCHHVQRGPVVAAMLATFEANNDAALEFWKSIADTSVGFDLKMDPRRALRDLLMTTSHGQKDRVKAYSSEEIFRLCILAWNAWLKNEKRGVLRTSTSGNRPHVRKQRGGSS